MSSLSSLKSLGQHFLRQPKILAKIAQAVGKREVILEIGAGKGELTAFLLPQAKKLLAVEIDRKLFALLKVKFDKSHYIELYHKDILEFDFRRLGRKITVVGNIPYYLSNNLVYYLVEQRQFIDQAFLMFQHEFGSKLIGRRQRSFLTFFLQYYAQVVPLFSIPPSAFYPSPKVNSRFICIDFEKPYGRRCWCEDFLWHMLKVVFSQRRKKIVNSLKSLAGKIDSKKILADLGISQDVRPEELDLKDFIKIAELLYRRFREV